MKKFLPIFIFFIFVCYFFKPFFINYLLPIPSDTIVGLYNPFRDLFAKEYPRGVPFKNFLITDPVRQQYPWRELSISLEKKMELPLWNPYSFSGYPLMANFQSAVFYPLNILLFIFPFSFGWSMLVFLQPLLAGVFLYLYLKNLKLHTLAAFLGAVTFAFCGFSIAWLEWNTIIQVVLWVPLILLAKDKLLAKWTTSWAIVFFFAECAAFFGGHLQTLFYSLLITNSYLFLRVYQKTKQTKGKINFLAKYAKIYSPFLVVGILMYIVTAIQWFPTLQFINLSARKADQSQWQVLGWFIPWQHLVQFIAPDFFGNPTTLNYWGVWNYGEFIGFVGIIPLLMAIFAVIFRHDKKTYFFSLLAIFALLLSLPTPVAKLPFILRIPFVSTAQPTRLLFVVDFSLAILAALGFDYYMQKRRKIFIPISILSVIFIGLWGFIFLHQKIAPSISLGDIIIAKRNLIFPTSIFIGAAVVLVLFAFLKSKVPEKIRSIIYLLLVLLTIVDLFRFGQKFISFNGSFYLYPQTKTISFLQQHVGNNRISMLDSRILPPNFSTIFRLQTIEGYDPLYIQRYGELVAATERNRPDISTPFGFNRIITPHRADTPLLINLAGVKYVLSLSDLSQPWLKKVFQEGETNVYENIAAFPRAFFVSSVTKATSKIDAIHLLFDNQNNLKNTAIVEGDISSKDMFVGAVSIMSYSENAIILKTENNRNGFLVLTDVYYPTWHATIDGKETTIYITDYAFRGIQVPSGRHTVIFYDTLF